MKTYSYQNLKSSHSQKGLSLLELMLVLLGFAMILVLIFVQNISRQEHTQSLQAADAINNVFNDLQDIVTNQVDFTGISMTTVAKMNNLPVMLGKGPSYHTPWGGDFSLAPSSSSVGSNDLAAITLTGVPKSQCQQIATIVSPTIYDTTVNGSVVPLGPPPTTQMPGRANVDFNKLQALCNNSNTMVFRQLKNLNPTLYVHGDDTQRYALNPAMNPILGAQMANRRAAIQARETVQSGL